MESGQASGTTITTGNSAVGGDAADQIVQNGSSTLQYSNAVTIKNALCARCAVDASSSTAFWKWSTSLASPSEVWGRDYVYLPAAPNTESRVISFYQGGAFRGYIAILGTRAIRVSDLNFTSQDSVFTLATATVYRLEFHFKGSATVGQIDVNIYAGDSLSTSGTVSLTNANTGTGTDEIDFGHIGSGVNAFTYYFDDIQVNSTGFPGPSTTTASGIIIPTFEKYPPQPRIGAYA